MDKTQAHEAAEQYAGIENDDAEVIEQADGTFKVVLSSDVVVYVTIDGNCEQA
jgi:hypothetical protein